MYAWWFGTIPTNNVGGYVRVVLDIWCTWFDTVRVGSKRIAYVIPPVSQRMKFANNNHRRGGRAIEEATGDGVLQDRYQRNL